jgi:hypothetical protein
MKRLGTFIAVSNSENMSNVDGQTDSILPESGEKVIKGNYETYDCD